MTDLAARGVVVTRRFLNASGSEVDAAKAEITEIVLPPALDRRRGDVRVRGLYGASGEDLDANTRTHLVAALLG